VSDSQEKNEARVDHFVDRVRPRESGYASVGSAEHWSLGVHPHTTSNGPIDA
jgi:hypothetical protein